MPRRSCSVTLPGRRRDGALQLSAGIIQGIRDDYAAMPIVAAPDIIGTVKTEDRHEITRQRVDELTRFLPAFATPGRKFTKEWAGGESIGDRTYTMRYPVYHEDVCEFFGLAARRCWQDLDYTSKNAHDMLADEDFISTCTLAELRTMLTLCVRGERFCDGFWEGQLESGKIVRLLERLVELRETIED